MNEKIPSGQDESTSFSEGIFFMKKPLWRRLLLFFCICLLSFSACCVLLLFGFTLYTASHIDYRGDELLFSAARRGSVTHFYVNAEGACGTLSAYVPVEYRVEALGGEEKRWYSYDEISEYVKDGFLSVEDRKFFSHHGVDVGRTALAALNRITRRRPVFGASTITQQVIKNISGDREVTLERKISEILRALHLEKKYTKEEIFEVYLNIVPMGDNLVGIGAAAHSYFGKEPSELTLAEAATLVGVTNAPARYHPREHAEAAREKRDRVLSSMEDFGLIDRELCRAAQGTPFSVLPERSAGEKVHSWFLETVLSDLTEDLKRELGMGEESVRTLLLTGGLSVYTTLRPEVQSILEEELSSLSSVPKGLHYAMVVTDAQTDTLVGIVGNVGEKTGNRLLNYATVPRAPGSALKPLALYAPLLEEKRIHAATVLDDVPLAFREEEGTLMPYPRNTPNVYQGLITVTDALRLSKNTVAMRLYEMRGAERIYASLREDFLFDTLVRERKRSDGRTLTDLAPAPLALGQLTDGVSLRRLTEAYSVFPAEGVMRAGRSYLAVLDADGTLLYENRGKEKRVFSEACARIMNQMLSRVVEDGTARVITLRETVDTAGKTGTTSQSRDRIFVGYTPYYTAGIWCGYGDGTGSVPSDAPSHLALWDSVMQKVHRARLSSVKEEETLRFSVEGLERCEFCMDSGELFSDACLLDLRGDRSESAYFTADNRPSEVCSAHVILPYDFMTMAVACRDCPAEWVRPAALIRVPPRSFSMEITVTDAQYVFRGESEALSRRGDSYDIPYFYYILPPEEYCGRSEGKKQYNANCYLHDG